MGVALLIFRPTPSRRLFSHSQFLNNPPPPGVGCAGDNIDLPGVLDMACRHRIVPSRLIRYRSFDYSKLTCGLSCRSALPLRSIGYDGRSEAWLAASASRQRRSRHSLACGLASLSLSVRYGRRDDDALQCINLRTVSMAGDGVPYQGAFFISIRSCFHSPTPFRPALRLSDTRNGTGLICRSSFRCSR